MQTINDKVFGQMQYFYSWEKEELLKIGNEEKKIKVVVEAYPGDGILDIQCNKYLEYQQKKEVFVNQIPKVLLEYCQDNDDDAFPISIKDLDERKIMDAIKIDCVYFARDGHYGFLCNCAWDEEHGLCILLSEKPPRIIDQDELI